MNKRLSLGKMVLILGLVIVIAGVALGGYTYAQWYQANKKAQAVIEVMKELVPNFGVDTGVYGNGRDPLGVLSIRDIDIVGGIEIPAIDVNAPVTAQGYEEECFATWVSGSPIKGSFRLIGGRMDVFRKLPSLKPGDVIVFTDVDGVRYNYSVYTQLHLKDWDTADYDLMLCSRSDDQTQFVVGCTRS